jgi:hypothetical protein
MLKARSGNLVVFGLSEENVKRLKEGKPLLIDGSQVGIEGVDILIMHGETELHIRDELIEKGVIRESKPN